jgi:hypothetical protein
VPAHYGIYRNPENFTVEAVRKLADQKGFHVLPGC